jgi:hypothetical protein
VYQKYTHRERRRRKCLTIGGEAKIGKTRKVGIKNIHSVRVCLNAILKSLNFFWCFCQFGGSLIPADAAGWKSRQVEVLEIVE